MIFLKIKEFSLAMHHGKFYIEHVSTEFQSIMEVSHCAPVWLYIIRKARTAVRVTFLCEIVGY